MVLCKKRELLGDGFVKILVFGWLENPDISYTDLAQTASALGIDVSCQTIEKRMPLEAGDTMKATLETSSPF